MKIVTVCLGCYHVTVNDKPEMSISEITKLMIAIQFNPDSVLVDGYVCANCRKSFPKEYYDKLIMRITSLVFS